MPLEHPIAATPSVTPGAAPNPAATAPAPSAPATPTTLADYAALAAASMKQPSTPTDAAQGSPAAAATESAPASTPDDGTPPTEPQQTLTAPAEPATEADPSETDPTAEEQAGWTEGERRIHGALQKEREKRREAKAETKALREEMEALKARLNTPTPAESQAAAQPKDTPQAPPAAAPATMPDQPLADCQTFEAVEARVMQAAQLEAQVLRMQAELARNGAEPVKTLLLQNGVKTLHGQPLENVSDEQIGDFLAKSYEGCRLTQISADARKRFLTGQAQAFEQAKELLPELADKNSTHAKAFSALVQQMPWITRLGPHWPTVAATYLVGEVAVNKTRSATAKPAATPPVAKPAPAKPAPAAPARTAAALPPKTESDELAAKIRNGTATMAEIKTYARQGISQST